MAERDLIFHGHFYQPPRENPWTDRVGREPSASPFHDWNARIAYECYRPNAYGRVVDGQQRVRRVVNNYAHLSFNFGATLLRWLERHDQPTLQRLIQADQESARRCGGHGNAIAQGYNHIILPLADAEDRRTQIRWGLAVFGRLYGREAEAMWLPETAANHRVLDDLIDHGLRYAILAPQQAGRVRPVKGGRWKDARGGKVDPSVPYLYRHRDGSGRGLAVYFYDGPLAQQVAFGEALSTSEAFLAQLQAADGRRRDGNLVHVAVDGETAGHHHAWGERVLAHVLSEAAPKAGWRVTNYAQHLDEHPPALEVELDLGPQGEGSSWSCAHGVGRWIRDCGCSIGHTRGWNQRWRIGLRKALDLLRDGARPFFQEEGGKLWKDPWAARDAYIQVILEPGEESRRALLAEHGRGDLGPAESERALALLEMQHQLMLQYTSCGWFFDDISGLESAQVLRYAARALDLWTELGGSPPAEAFLDFLSQARSNDPARGSGAEIFREIVTGETVGPRQLLVHGLLESDRRDRDAGILGLHRYTVHDRERHEHDEAVLHSGRVEVQHLRTGQVHHGSCAVLQRGDLDLRAGLAEGDDAEAHAQRGRRLGEALAQGRVEEALAQDFGDFTWNTEDLLDSGARELLTPFFQQAYAGFRHELGELHRRHHRLLDGLDRLGLDYPDELRALGPLTVRWSLGESLDAALRGDASARGRLETFMDESRRLGVKVLDGAFTPRLEQALLERVDAADAEGARRVLDLASLLDLWVAPWRAQEAWLQKADQLGPEADELGAALGLAPPVRDEDAEAVEGEE